MGDRRQEKFEGEGKTSLSRMGVGSKGWSGVGWVVGGAGRREELPNLVKNSQKAFRELGELVGLPVGG